MSILRPSRTKYGNFQEMGEIQLGNGNGKRARPQQNLNIKAQSHNLYRMYCTYTILLMILMK